MENIVRRNEKSYMEIQSRRDSRSSWILHEPLAFPVEMRIDPYHLECKDEY